MARTVISITNLPPGGFIQQPAGTTADPTNDHVLNLPAGSGDGKAVALENIEIRVLQTDATARVLTILAGDDPPALLAGRGNLDQSIAQNQVFYIRGLESARFMQNDGTVHIDLAASFAGTIWAFRLR